ncbi:MAG: proliferating cell nuclear antigen (pcna) [Candidatus Woesearchaeota archaeon]
MKLTLADPKYFKESISIISELVSEASFKITPEAIELVAIDPANVAMVIFKLFSSTFVEYDVKKTETIGVNLNNLKQVLRRVKPTELITLDVNEDKLRITVQGTTKRTFSIPIIDVEEKEQRIPELEFPFTVKTESSVLDEAIEDAAVFAEAVSFIVEKEKFTIMAEGDLNKVIIEVKPSEKTKIIADGKAKAKYSIEYLKKMISGSKIADEVVIQLNTDYPLKLEYKEVDKVLLSFILAPRVETD